MALTSHTFTNRTLFGDSNFSPVAAMLHAFKQRSEIQAVIVDVSTITDSHDQVAIKALQLSGIKVALFENKSESSNIQSPAPWLLLHELEKLNIFPAYLAVLITDRSQAIEEGHNAGVWTVGAIKTPKALALPQAELETLKTQELGQRLSDAADVFRRHGVHYLIESVGQVPGAIAAINTRLRDGGRP